MQRRRRKTDVDGSLTVLMLQILLVLAEGERHVYAILKAIESRSDQEFKIGTATLYRSVDRLAKANLITEVESQANGRRLFRITDDGLARARREARRLQSVVRWAAAASVLQREAP